MDERKSNELAALVATAFSSSHRGKPVYDV